MTTARRYSPPRARRLRLAFALAVALVAAIAWTSSASAAEPWWHLDVVAAPTNLPPEVEVENAKHEKEKKFEEAQLEVTATNIGDAYVKTGDVTLSETLSPKLKVVFIEGHTARKPPPPSTVGQTSCPTVEAADKLQEKGEPIECK